MFLGSSAVSKVVYFPSKVLPPNYISVGDSFVAYYEKAKRWGKILVLFHGNGELIEHYIINGFKDTVLKDYEMDVLFCEFRGYGYFSTAQPSLATIPEDITRIQKMLIQFGYEDQDIFIMGSSLGSLYAIEFVNQFPDIGGLIVERGFNFVNEFITKRWRSSEPVDEAVVLKECDQLFNHKQKLSKFKGKALFIHCKDDNLVPVIHAQENWACCASSDKRLLLFDVGGHNHMRTMNEKSYDEALQQFLNPRRSVIYVIAIVVLIVAIIGTFLYKML